MSRLLCWIRVSWAVVHYALYRLRLAPCPSFAFIYPQIMEVVGTFLKWPERLRVEGAENCPSEGPAAFAGNHLKFEDPPTMYRAIYLASGERIFPHFLGRDDIFENMPFPRLVDYNKVMDLCGSVLFTRDSVRLAQLKPIIKILRAGECFALYPGRTRSRSGFVMECPEEADDPGGVALFVAQAQRGQRDLKVKVVPMTRTYNPVTKKSAICFGKVEYLAPDADRVARYEFDCMIAERIGAMIELNIPQALCALLYNRCVHGMTGPVAADTLQGAVGRILSETRHPYVDPGAREGLKKEFGAAMAYLQERGMLRVEGGTVHPDGDAILTTPALDYAFRETNPVQYLANQVVHLSEVVRTVEDVTRAMDDYPAPVDAETEGVYPRTEC